MRILKVTYNSLGIFPKPKFCTRFALTSPVVIHYGTIKYSPELMKPVDHKRWSKPGGGLWTSPVDSNWGWKDWCISNEFRDCREENSFKLKFIDKAKILLIDSLDDLIALPKVTFSIGDSYKEQYPDFKLLATLCDAIWLTEEGQRDTHLSHPYNLYGWDCESVFIINSKCCYQIS